MSLGLLLPIGLAALAALLLPLVLHLERRTEPQATPFAALRWLSMHVRPQRRIRLEELWLLLLRLLLVAAVAILFARPVLFSGEGGRPWVVVAPGVDIAEARAAVRDSRAEWHWLAAGFPSIETAEPARPQPLSSLLREIDARLPAEMALTVIVPMQVTGLDGERPRLSRRIDWQVVEGALAPAQVMRSAPAPTLVVRHVADRKPSTRYLHAAAIAWHATTGSRSDQTASQPQVRPIGIAPSTRPPLSDIAPSTQAIPTTARWLAWLAPGDLPPAISRWIERGGIALIDERAVLPRSVQARAVAWRDGDGRALAYSTAAGRGRIIQLARPLLPAANAQLLDAQFPRQLRALFDEPPLPPQRARAEALRPLAGGPMFSQTPKSLDPWLALLAAALFVLERWFASSARRERRT